MLPGLDETAGQAGQRRDGQRLAERVQALTRTARRLGHSTAGERRGQPDVDEGTGFGTNAGLRTGGKIFAMLVGGEFVVKLPADRCAVMVAAGSAGVFEVGQRRMREWVRIADVDQARWCQLAREARAYVAG